MSAFFAKSVVSSILIFAAMSIATSSKALAYEPSVYPALEKAAPRVPLGGSFEAGEKMLRAADPVAEANAAYEKSSPRYILVCGFACTAVGVENDAGADSESLKIPATSDTLSPKNKGYNEAAYEFAKKFNLQLRARLVADNSIDDHAKSGAAKSPASDSSAAVPVNAADAKAASTDFSSPTAAAATPAPPIKGALSDKDLTINGVTIGKSNLYNATGKFGTNMFKKEEGGLFIICWKGDDGTTMAFESDKGGGPDQTITRALILGSGIDYPYAKECKASKKVSATALSLAGIHVGQALASRTDAATERTDSSQVWKYESEKKSKKLSEDLEVKLADGKVTSLSIWKH